MFLEWIGAMRSRWHAIPFLPPPTEQDIDILLICGLLLGLGMSTAMPDRKLFAASPTTMLDVLQAAAHVGCKG